MDRAFEQRLADPLGDAAMDLAFDDRRVHDPPDIVDGRVADDGDRPGLGVDLDLAGGRAVGMGVQPGGNLLGGGERRLGGDLEQPDRTVGAEHGKTAVGVADIRGGGLQQAGRRLAPPVHDPTGRAMEDGAAQAHRAVGVGAGAVDRPVGVAEDDPDPFEGDLEDLGDHLGEAGLVPLARSLGADDRFDPAFRLHGDIGAFVGRRAGRFQIGDDADPGPLAARAGGPAPGRKTPPVDLVQHGREILAEGARIVVETEPRAVGQGIRGDQVAPPKRRPVHPRLVGGEIDQALDDLGHLGPPGAAIDRNRDGVGERAAHRDPHRRDGVWRPGHLEQVGEHGEGDRVGPDIAEIVDPESHDPALGVEGPARLPCGYRARGSRRGRPRSGSRST